MIYTDPVIIYAMLDVAKSDSVDLQVLKEKISDIEETLLLARGGACYLVTFDANFRKSGREAMMTMRCLNRDEAEKFTLS